MNFLYTLYRILYYLLEIYSFVIVIDALMSWVPSIRNSSLGQFIDRMVEPYVRLFRQGPLLKLMYATGIDISPVIALFLIYFVQSYALGWLFNILARIFA
ncbi:MAG: YggT family protein [Lactobacillus sp.]|jgi:YggT family protein|uniref:YggT family protein n=1 Tax=Lactobacillus porci TaxID=2012477 RepID=A0A6A8MAW9_9LACO|nr:YggT family protein [Lactobacillus porci]MDD6415738.1 YggT family protein [Lactobacillus porci]MST86316.1 YggT family protein [Lactobacillus porci]